MPTHQASTIIGAPAESIWQILTEVNRLPQWYSVVRDVRLTGPGELGIGAVLRITFARGRRLHELEVMIVTWDPPWHVTLRQLRGPMKQFGVSVDLTSRSDGTLIVLTLRYASRLPPFAQLIGAWLARRIVDADLRRALTNLRRLAERRLTAPSDVPMALAFETAKRPHR